MAFKDGSILGPVIINPSGSANTSIASTSNSGTVSIGNTNSGLITVDCGTAGLTIGTTSNAHTSTFGSNDSTSATTVQSGSGALAITSTNSALNINSGTGTIGISTDSTTTTVNFGTGSAVKTVTLGSTSGTGTTNLQSGSGGINIPSFSAGDVTSDSSGLLASTNDTAGFVLTSNGAGNVPTFQAVASGGGAWNLIATKTASSSSDLHWDNTEVTSTYNQYMILLNDIVPSSTSALYFRLALSTDNGSTFQPNGNQNGWGMGGVLSTPAAAYWTISSSDGFTGSLNHLSGFYNLVSLGRTITTNTTRGGITGQAFNWIATGPFGEQSIFTGGDVPNGSVPYTYNYIKIYFDTGDITSGTASLYGFSLS